MIIVIADHPIEFIDESGAHNDSFERYRADFSVEPEFTITVKDNAVNGVSYADGCNSRFFLVHKAISDFLLTRDTLNLHASALVFEGKAYLFSAPSGTGKSTHTKLWREVFGDRVAMISDDQPFVSLGKNGIFVYGSPYNGKEKLGANIKAPIGGICLCERGDENRLIKLSSAEAMIRLSPNIYIPHDAELAAAALSLVKRLAQTVPVYRHVCNMEPEAAVYAMKHLTDGAL